MKYGARHLKRAIEKVLVQPLSNLIASDQVHGGDLIRIDFDSEPGCLAFMKEAEALPAYAMVQMMDSAPSFQAAVTAASTAEPQPPRVISAKIQRTR
jgi:hypothetical protein